MIKFSKHSMNSQLRSARATRATAIDYMDVITKQQQVIASLQEEILLLKSYISLEKANTSFELANQECSMINTNSSISLNVLNSVLEEQTKQNFESLANKLAEMLELKLESKQFEEQVLESVRKYKEKVSGKNQTVFVQRIKEIKVPITVEKIVEKQVQKIVYVDRYMPAQTDRYNPISTLTDRYGPSSNNADRYNLMPAYTDRYGNTQNNQKKLEKTFDRNYQRPYESQVIIEEQLREEEQGRTLNKTYSQRFIGVKGRQEYREKDSKPMLKTSDSRTSFGPNYTKRRGDKQGRRQYY